MAFRPLTENYSPDDPVIVCAGHEIITFHDFMVKVNAVSEALPALPAVINLCENRTNFMISFISACIRGQTTILTSSRAVEMIKIVQQNHPDAYVLDDSERSFEDVNLVNYNELNIVERSITDNLTPEIDDDLPAAIIYTSGSTGLPVANHKKWSNLVSGAQTLGRTIHFNDGNKRMIAGTIPPQHMFGMETTVMLPFIWGMPVHSSRPLLPNDLRIAMKDSAYPTWVMTTPLQLRAAAGENLELNGIEGVISATMPLYSDISSKIETLWHTQVYEIYGSTETGMIAMRRPSSDKQWVTCDGVTISGSNEGIFVSGGHIPEKVLLEDEISVIDENTFVLHGRSADMIKIGGKRMSLQAMNHTLLKHPDVTDGIFYFDDENSNSPRMIAIIVGSKRLERKELNQYLKKYIDPVFFPRSIYYTGELPRESNGKISLIRLKELIARLKMDSNR